MNEQTASKPIEDMSFREAMQELQNVVSKLEANTMEVEESLESFERGVALLKSLRLRMSEAQQKVDVLMGQLEATDDDAVVDSTLRKA